MVKVGKIQQRILLIRGEKVSIDEEKQEVVTNCDHLQKLKFSPVNAGAFTEHGAIMAASLLKAPKAIEVSLFVVRAFFKLRETIAGHKELARKIAKLDRKLGDHDDQIMVLIEAIKQLMDPKPPPKTRRIGFHTEWLQPLPPGDG